ncbi:MAG: hypothetical protein V3R29_09530 [Candidatus Acidoferrales bacterium]
MPLGDRKARRLLVFSHPNHELAVFGLTQRYRPHIVYLTDGGGEHRVGETRRGLETLGLLGQARFLNHSEKAFYQALLDQDTDFYRQVAAQVAQLMETVQPEQVFCDAVEFYNPVHDISLPITRAAVGTHKHIPLFEMPLIYQKPTETETYDVQRFPASRRHGAIELRLTPEELETKIKARDEIYSQLRNQMGRTICDLPPAHLGLEMVRPAESALPTAKPDQVLRYENRGRRLQERGEVQRVITYADHYLPVASALLAP